MTDAEGDDPQAQAGKSAAKTMDSLYKPAVPGRFADEETLSRIGDLRFMGNQMVDISL